MSHQIAFSDEQAMLLDTAADFCRKHSPIETVRASLHADQIDAETWQELTELMSLTLGIGVGFANKSRHTHIPETEPTAFQNI